MEDIVRVGRTLDAAGAPVGIRFSAGDFAAVEPRRRASAAAPRMPTERLVSTSTWPTMWEDQQVTRDGSEEIPPEANVTMEDAMPRAPSNNGYSRDDWNHMISGCYVRAIEMNKLLYVMEVGTAETGNGFVLYGEDQTQGARTYGQRVTLSYTNENAEQVFDFNRPRGRIVHLNPGLSYMVRPLIRRTRRKGLFCDDYEAVNLSTGTRGVLQRVVERTYIANVLFGTAPNPEARAGGQLTVVSAGNLPQSRVLGATDNQSINSIVGQLGHNLGRPEVQLNQGAAEWDEATVVALGAVFGLRLPGSRLMWHDATIGNVIGDTIHLYENADLLLQMVRDSYPEFTVTEESSNAGDNF